MMIWRMSKECTSMCFTHVKKTSARVMHSQNTQIICYPHFKTFQSLQSFKVPGVLSKSSIWFYVIKQISSNVDEIFLNVHKFDGWMCIISRQLESMLSLGSCKGDLVFFSSGWDIFRLDGESFFWETFWYFFGNLFIWLRYIQIGQGKLFWETFHLVEI